MLKSFKYLKEERNKQYTYIINCVEDVSVEISIPSLKSIFNAGGNSLEYHFILSQENEMLENITKSVFSEITKTSDFTNLYFHVYKETEEESFTSQLHNLCKSLDKKNFCFLKLGVQIPVSFFSKMSFCHDNFSEYYKIGTPGIVFPIFNGKVGNQQLLLPEDLEENKLDEINDKLIEIFSNNKQQRWVLTGVGSDAAFLLSKDIIEKIGLPDYYLKDKYNSTTMMTCYITRLLKNKYLSIISGDTYVYFPEAEKYIPSNIIPVKLYSDEKPNKLAVLYKIRIRTDKQKEIFIESLRQTNKIADNIYIIDCGSNLSIATIVKEQYSELWEKVRKYERIFSTTDDKRDYNKLIDYAEKDENTWILSLEGNETFPEYVSRKHFDKLMSPPNDTIFGYTLSEFYMWNDNEWRFDGVWLNSNSVRLAKLIPNHRISGTSLLATQSGYVPALSKENIRYSNLSLKMWNFSSPKEREESYKFVSTVDPTQDWKYFLDDKTLRLHPYVEGTITTYSPVSFGGPRLVEWLDHVWSFSDEIILGNDRDKLQKIYKDIAEKLYNVKVVPCNMSDNFGEGRNEIIKHSTSDYIFQLDLDERILDSRILHRLISSPSKAFMFSIDNLQPKGQDVVVTNTVRLFHRMDGKAKYWGYLHETVDDFVRKNNIPLSHSPVKLVHFGYLWMSSDEAFQKMQKYMSINIRQMKDFPEDPRAYYNLAMHLIEDGINDTAIRLLNMCVFLSKGTFILPVIELAKVHLAKSNILANHLLKVREGTSGAREAKEFSKHLINTVTPLLGTPIKVSPNHANQFFIINKEAAKELNDLLFNIEKKHNMI